ncbi:NAD(P)H-dependent oxidoreductase [Nocardiopsis eucommiae]|uniref:NAD(P)H-dependent oxidoreductase n=1 Tax=Nocardiopsis eucommiae TaxID=2831970 RepID=A0A975QLG4_9ACTN|nr:NAD(P)H-dependent oxidoreductase [Nocardiopsis eucommiae]
MAEQRLRVAIIIGSIRQGRFGPTAAAWIATHAGLRGDLDVDVIDLAEARLPEVMSDDGGPRPQATRDLACWLASADAFVIVTPEYNNSYPASLKNGIDWYQSEWAAKPVAFLSYGGVAGGVRAVEHLRPVFSEVDAVTIRKCVSLHHYRERFDSLGTPVDPSYQRTEAKEMLDQLVWWAEALRTHRARQPYPS